MDTDKQRTFEQRTLEFSKRVLNLCKELNKSPHNFNLTDQLSRSACSVGANFREATEAESRADFVHKLCIAKKESKETVYWLELVEAANQNLKTRLSPLKSEAIELLKMLSASVLTAKGIKRKAPKLRAS